PRWPHCGVGRRSRAARARRRGGCVTAEPMTSAAAVAMPAAAESPGIVTADHLSKWYGQVIGLNDVSASVPPGITGLLGPNGAGKSTFLKLITGQLKPNQGTVAVLG